MPQATIHFPAGFLWGTATAAHQVEGNNSNNNWSAWEEQPGRIHQGQRAGLACDWWGGRWREDFDRAAETVQNAHRLSIEWSRVQPTPTHWDEAAIDYYREMVRGLHQRGMTPLVTLHHFTDPLWLTDQGGWENPQAPEKFAAFVTKIVDALKEYVSLWVTINEPIVYSYSGYMEGAFPPGKHDIGATFNVMANLVRGHAAAYQAIKSLQKTAQVGFAHHYRGFYPSSRLSPLDAAAARTYFNLWNNSFANALVDGRFRFAFKTTRIPAAARTQDFFGLNYYTADQVAFAPFDAASLFTHRRYPKDAEQSETGFLANLPAAFFDALKWALHYRLPIYITENGTEDSTDATRPNYIVQHLHQLWRGVNFNWPIKGYFYWSLVDNFEWERGWSQRFGLWGLDVETQARIRRPSVDLYSAICKENGISSEMVERWAPAVFAKMFPG